MTADGLLCIGWVLGMVITLFVLAPGDNGH